MDMTLFSCQLVPLDCKFIVFPDTLAVLITMAQVILGKFVSLFRSQLEPFKSELSVLANAYTIPVYITETTLGVGISLFSCEFEPLKRGFEVFADPIAIRVFETLDALRVDKPGAIQFLLKADLMKYLNCCEINQVTLFNW